MKLSPRYLAAYVAALAPIAVFGFAGTFLGYVAVLAVTFGIFFGTLSLGRTPAQNATSALVQPFTSSGESLALVATPAAGSAPTETGT